jgi:hypothetical protein
LIVVVVVVVVAVVVKMTMMMVTGGGGGTHLATTSRGVHLLVSAAGMNFLLFGVSRVFGRMARTVASEDTPLLSEARLLTSWCTAALAIP